MLLLSADSPHLVMRGRVRVSVDAMKLLARLTCKYSQCENLWRTAGAGRPATGNNSPTGLAGLRGWAGSHWLTDKPSDREERRQRERERERERQLYKLLLLMFPFANIDWVIMGQSLIYCLSTVT